MSKVLRQLIREEIKSILAERNAKFAKLWHDEGDGTVIGRYEDLIKIAVQPDDIELPDGTNADMVDWKDGRHDGEDAAVVKHKGKRYIMIMPRFRNRHDW